LAKGCALKSDCRDPLVCVFQLCHDECHKTSDCTDKYGDDSGARCVSSGETGAAGGGGMSSSGTVDGVCTFPKKVVDANHGTPGIDTSCQKNSDCPGAEHCAEDHQCRDGCESDGDCLGTQQCTLSGVCAEPSEVSMGHLTGATGGTGGTGGGTGGTGATSPGGKSGDVEEGGGPGTMIVDECPDTGTTNPEEHSGEQIMAPVTWRGLHHVSGYIDVEASLTLAPCAVVKFDTNGYIFVRNNGSIKALGDATSPVVLTSDKSVPKKGDWGGIDIQADASNDSTFENVIVEYAGNNYNYGYNVLQLDGMASAAFKNVTIRHSGDDYCAVGLAAGSEPQAFESVRVEDSKKGLCAGADVIGSLGSFTSDSPISVTTTTLTGDATWKDFGTPYVLSGALTVNAELTLDAGVTFKMPANGNIYVDNNGALITNGTADNPVTITSAKNSPSAGDWGEIVFGANASNNSLLTNTVIEYGGSSGYPTVEVSSNSSAGFDTVTVSNTAEGACAIDIQSSANVTQFDDVSFENDTCPLSVPASQVGSLGSLTADGGYIQVGNEYITKAVTWKNFGIPYRFASSLTVQAALTLDAGVEIKLPHGGQIAVNTNGAIKANGTSKEHVVFDSAIDGPSPGEWNYINIDATAAGTSKFSYTDFMFGGGYAGNGVIYLNDKPASFDHCSFTSNDTCDYYVYQSHAMFVDAGGNTSDNSMSSDGGPYPCN
jgi:hypothetical protein